MKIKRISTILSAVLLLLTGCANSDNYPPFTGVDISEESITNFSTINNKQNYPQIFCCGNNIVYFSNPRDRLKLYSFDGEKTSCLSDIQAFSLNYYNGSVYFLSSDASVNLGDLTNVYGSLYCYDTKNGKVSQISDTLMSNLRVDEKGIYYTSDYEEVSYVYRTDFQGEESQRLYRGFSVQHLDGYSLINETKKDESGIDYFLKSDKDKIWIMSDAITLFDCVYNGIYYYRDYNDSYHLYSLSLRNGEKKLLYGESSFSDYTFFEDNLYLAIQGRLFRYSEDGELMPFEFSYNKETADTGNVVAYSIENLYVGNGAMYALVSYLENQNIRYCFAKLEISEDEEVVSINVMG